MIAAYNEEKLIAETLRTLLATDYKGEIEVVVVDDGSTDQTAAEIERIARNESRIRLFQQENRGKARALQRGLAAAHNGIVVFIDADTQCQRDTLPRLLEPFADERIGAVSGHAKVGNLRTFIARCQALEYTCGFNLDRRAYNRWKCITVVPGAISAIRKDAIDEAGGLSLETLAEDTDLTLSLHRHRQRIVYVPDAIAWTEAPETVPRSRDNVRGGPTARCNVSGNIATWCSTGTIARSAGSVYRASGFSKSFSWPLRRWWICSCWLRCRLAFGARCCRSSSYSWRWTCSSPR